MRCKILQMLHCTVHNSKVSHGDGYQQLSSSPFTMGRRLFALTCWRHPDWWSLLPPPPGHNKQSSLRGAENNSQAPGTFTHTWGFTALQLIRHMLRPGAGHSPTWISCWLNPSGFPSPQESRAHCYCWTFHTETKANSACNKNNHHQRGQFHNKHTYYSLSELVVSSTKLPRVLICWAQFTFGMSFRAAHKN